MTAPTPGARRRGRFAPSPTGPLHFGSLVAAVGSFADARAAGGAWLVRMEDLDRPRVVPGAADAILRTLDAFGLHWDASVAFQSRRTDAYAAAIEQLARQGRVYPCGCTRREIALGALPGAEGPIYPGTCRHGLPPGRAPRSLRLRAHGPALGFVDRIHGPQRQDVARAVGDFVLRRADGLHAYQLAVVVDDAAQGITDVVRGADLLLSTPRQMRLQACLGLSQPTYAHLPLVLAADGRKLSKSQADLPVDAAHPLPALLRAWAVLGQAPPPAAPDGVSAFWDWALPHWDMGRVPARNGPCGNMTTA
ncbi:tRNA glutamyl-Q(34) synthetase GluQRS [uncultured Thiohalocapsa sp.]|uniref:tRNA glutamyl-Q(34) synthetase GluQRS n=1 Tax=uncultured Thiohalocapsa sp. TaxID=768990 RepID=UPI002600BD84|nr:tRNA glutamyl-Q(34) synthetase GluQRS [uncultured Thiohalocapsa sp.]